MARCKACGAEIVFIRTAAGKKMPCDARQMPAILDVAGPDLLINSSGVLFRCRAGDHRNLPEAEHDAFGWRPHWISCPGADQMRRRSNA